MATVKNIPMVYLGPEPWDGLWRNRHHLISRFGRDRTVVYLKPPLRLKQLRKRLLGGRLAAGDVFRARTEHVRDRLRAFRTGVMCPTSPRRSISAITWRNWSRSLLRCLAELDVARYVLWISRPAWYPASDQFTQEILVYDIADEDPGYSGVIEEIRRGLVNAEELTLKRADVVIVVSDALRASKCRFNTNTHKVANGVDVGAYNGLNGMPAPRRGRRECGRSNLLLR